MATLADLRTRIKQNLYSAQTNERPWVGSLSADSLTADTSFDVADASEYSAQDILEFPDGEQCLVTSVDENNDTLTVIRGWGDVAAADRTNGDWFVKNPRFSIDQLDSAITSSLRELEGQGVWTWGYGTLTITTGNYLYDLSETDIVEDQGVVSVYYESTNYNIPQPLAFRFGRAHTTLAAAGHSLTIPDFGEKTVGDTLYYIYAKRIDDVTDLMARQETLIEYGATARLLAATMAPRTQDPGQLTDRTVQPGQGGRDSNWYRAEHRLALTREAAVLKVEKEQFAGSVRTNRMRRFRP